MKNERKNRDWSITLDGGVSSKKIVEGFFEECGLETKDVNKKIAQVVRTKFFEL